MRPRRRVQLVSLALVVLWASGCLSRGFPCSRDADCPGGVFCEGGTCDARTEAGDSFGTTCPDALEPNDAYTSAALLAPGVYPSLEVCGADDDWFVLSLARDDRLLVAVTGDAGAGDLDLGVYDPAGRLIASSESETATERVSGVRAAVAGSYYVRVYGFRGAAGRYTLRLERETRSCALSASVSLQAASGATPLPATSSGSLLSAADVYHRIGLQPGDRLSLTLSYDSSQGTVGLGLYGAQGERLRPVALATGGAPAVLGYGPVSRPEELFVRLFLRAGPLLAYRLDATTEGGGPSRGARVRGQIRYEDRPPGLTGLGPPTPAPLGGVAVEVLRVADGYVLGTGRTDAEGLYDIAFENYGASEVSVRAVARRDDDFVRLQILRSGSCEELYAVESGEVVDSERAPDATLDATALASDVGGAFNILATLDRGIALMRGLGVPSTSRQLTVLWERGQAFDCGSCYEEFSDTIFVGGSAADPDEYDDSVLLHELGHFYEVAFARTDSQGGPHDGTPTEPTLAWSEGFATYFSAAVLGSPVYIDVVGDELWIDDLEAYLGTGTVGGGISGAISENLVSALLWDLHDGPGAEAFDGVTLGSTRVLLPTHAYLPSAARVDRGVDGVDLVDYLDGARCLEVAARAQLAPIISAHGFPYDFGGPAICQPKPRAPLRVQLTMRPVGPDGRQEAIARVFALADAEAVGVRLRLPPGWVLAGGSPSRWFGALRASEIRELRAVLYPGGSPESLLATATWVGPAGGRPRPAAASWTPSPLLRLRSVLSPRFGRLALPAKRRAP